jgi:hypothetical protein
MILYWSAISIKEPASLKGKLKFDRSSTWVNLEKEIFLSNFLDIFSLIQKLNHWRQSAC